MFQLESKPQKPIAANNTGNVVNDPARLARCISSRGRSLPTYLAAAIELKQLITGPGLITLISIPEFGFRPIARLDVVDVERIKRQQSV